LKVSSDILKVTVKQSKPVDIIPAYRYNIFMYSVEEAAVILGMDPSQVRRLLKNGEIRGKKLARDWVVLSLDYKRKRRLKRMTQYILKVKCPACGYLDEGVGYEAGSVYQARSAGLNCPIHEDEEMEVVEVASSEGGILWQDPMWLREEANLKREIDNLG